MSVGRVGQILAQRYRLIAFLGDGGTASVYLARHVLIDRLCAIKILRGPLSRDEVARDRFLREAKAVNRINHPNIVEISDFGESDGNVFLVMEYVAGEPLSRLIDRDPPGPRRTAMLGAQLAEALGRAHQMGVIHRDVKPSNVLVISGEAFDTAKLTDFGMAKLAGTPAITSSQMAMGTPGYMAPEYAQLGVIDGRGDLFSLGVVLYEAATGKRPFGADLQPQDVERGPAPLAEAAPTAAGDSAELTTALDRVLRRLLRWDPDDRPRDGFETAHLLRGALDGEPLHLPAAAVSSAQPRTALPHLATTAYDRIRPLCFERFERLSRRFGNDVSGAEGDMLRWLHEQMRIVDRLTTLVEQETVAFERQEEDGRALRAGLGQRLDELATRKSRALGWASTAAERQDRIRVVRDSGAGTPERADALMWEQAALYEEEADAFEEVRDLTRQMQELEGEINTHNDRLERDHGVLSAKLEGHVAALRSVALEMWSAMDRAETSLDAANR